LFGAEEKYFKTARSDPGSAGLCIARSAGALKFYHWSFTRLKKAAIL